MKSVIIKKNEKEYNEYKVEMRLTEGEILALRRVIARTKYEENPLVNEMLFPFERAGKKIGLEFPALD